MSIATPKRKPVEHPDDLASLDPEDRELREEALRVLARIDSGEEETIPMERVLADCGMTLEDVQG